MLLDKDGIIKRLLKSEEQASRELETLKSDPHPALKSYEHHLHQYVLIKFLLDDEGEITTHDLNELAEMSVAKAAKLNPNESVLLDVSKHCGSTTSAMTKKILLFMALEECFKLKFKDINTADIETTDLLAATVMDLIQSGGK